MYEFNRQDCARELYDDVPSSLRSILHCFMVKSIIATMRTAVRQNWASRTIEASAMEDIAKVVEVSKHAQRYLLELAYARKSSGIHVPEPLGTFLY